MLCLSFIPPSLHLNHHFCDPNTRLLQSIRYANSRGHRPVRHRHTTSHLRLNGLYILLSDRGDKSYTFHWRLYLHQSPTSGSIYHLLNDIDPTIWRFPHLPDQTVIYDSSLLGALKIGVLDPILHAHFLERLHQIPLVDSVRFRERITCRVWLKEALFALDDEGYIMLTRNVDDIEAEARNFALRNKSLGRRSVSRSCGSQA